MTLFDATAAKVDMKINPPLVALFQAVEALRVSDAPLIIQFIATHAGAGTSTLAAGFAHSAAAAVDGRVLLVNANAAEGLAADNLLPLLGPADRSLTPYMVRSDYDCPNLYHARLSGRFSASIPLSPAAVANCFTGLRERFSIVVLDCSPLDQLPQSAMLARYCDGTALVVRAETTRREDILAARRSIEAMGGQIIGAVFNRARTLRQISAHKGWTGLAGSLRLVLHRLRPHA